MNSAPLILDIKGNSLDDGPGIRTVVFFKGCPLSCVWCHNPESQKATKEIGFDPKECVDCGTCEDLCPVNAISRENPFFVDRDICTLCMECVAQCPSGALEQVGQSMTVEEITKRVVRDKPFYDTSGGGVTLSGGEPIMHLDFVFQLLKSLKKERIHTLVETCGQFHMNFFESRILPLIDTIYFDLKIFDSKDHKRFCGMGNKTILKNFKRLAKLAQDKNFELLARTPLAPGMTATHDNIHAIAGFLKENNIKKTQLLAYNPLWHEKQSKIGIEPIQKNDKAMASWMEPGTIAEFTAIFTDLGISVL